MTMEHSDTVGKLAEALVSVQSKLKPIKKNAENPAFKKDGKAIGYLDLAGLCEVVLPMLSAAGIAVVQGGDGQTLDTMLLHMSGEWIRTSLPMPAESNPQKLGSSITYFRRYALAAIVGAVSEDDDDDGNAASHTPARQPSAQPPANRPAPESAARPPAPAVPPASGGSPALLSVTSLWVDNGKKTGRDGTPQPWTKFTAKFSDGTRASTFDTKHGEILRAAQESGATVAVEFEKNGQYVNVADVAMATDTSDADSDHF